MPNNIKWLGRIAAIAVFSLTGLAGHGAPRSVVLPVGSVIPVRLDQNLSSKTSSVGDRFTVTVRYGSDDAGLPEGTRVEGVVSEVIRSRNGKPGVLDMNFRRIVTNGGQSRQVSGSLVSLDAKSVSHTDSGRLTATGDRGSSRLKWVGIGAGAGLLAGVLTKGNTIVDTIIGAGAGYLFNEFGNKPKARDVNLTAGSEFGIRLDRQLRFDTNRAELADYTGDTSNSGYDNRGNRTADDTSGNNVSYPAAIRMTIDDRPVAFGTARPFLLGQQVMVPFGLVSRAVPFDYRWDGSRKVVRVGSRGLSMRVGSKYARLNNERHELDAPAQLRNSSLYVPIEFIAMATGGTQDWDARTRTIAVTTDGTR